VIPLSESEQKQIKKKKKNPYHFFSDLLKQAEATKQEEKEQIYNT